MTQAYTAKLGLTAWKISIGAQKIDSLPLETYGMVSASFLLQDSLKKVWFFEETFLLANTSIKVVLEIPFLALTNADFQFGAKKLTWRSHTTVEALPTTSRVELINKRKFAKAALDGNFKTYVVHVATLDVPTAMPIHLSRASQV